MAITLNTLAVRVTRSGYLVALYGKRNKPRDTARAMSRANIEMVRVAYDVAYVKRSVEGVRDQFAEDFVWHNRPEWPGKSTYAADDMPALWADLDETFQSSSLSQQTSKSSLTSTSS